MRGSFWQRGRRRGQGLAEVAVVCSIMTSMAGGGASAAWQVMGSARRVVAITQMKQIYLAIQMRADDGGGLPAADMYPDLRRDPNAVRTSPRSIVKILGNAVPASLWIDPRAPEAFQKAGLTYIWNSSLNGRQLDQVDGHTWLLADMNAAAVAIPELVPQPKGIGYLVLYADGSAKYEMQPPPGLAKINGQALSAAVQAGAPGPAGDPNAAAGAGGATAPATPPPPKVVIPKDPDADAKKKEREAKRANPDEDDAVNE